MSKIVVIGCGIVGAAIAYELSLIPGLDITVIDKNTPAHGATGAALGVLMGAISHKKKGRAWRFRSNSLKRYQTLIPELEAQTGLKIPVNQQGILKLLFAGENLEKWQELQKFRAVEGWTLEIGDRAFITQHCPKILHEDIIGAVYSPQDRQINPVELTKALVAGARANGVKFMFGVEVQDFVTQTRLCLGEQDDDFAPSRQVAKKSAKQNIVSCEYLVTSIGQISVEELIISAGLGSTPLTQSLQQEIPIRPVLGQAIKLQLDRALGNADFQPVITGNDIHLVPLGNNQYWLGATVEFPTETEASIANQDLLAELMAGAIAFCPELKSATILETWSGKRPRPEGRAAPIIEKLSGYSNVLLATAHYRNGVLLAPATALEVVQMLTLTPRS
ncbi:FAD-dependent oxidoreductase [Pleurocapsa sp. CCALA 161]|uniref:NAD(P)/FAD-dependent oxidoreductase n=1 Tax=Pleurocapsa sp. CCALA 161 TaxID=2107688 RepID=UPI000D060929|nr:FAD-dependent oxidoreductase [Pleurocapsa sp. CCALA 161]PSB12190.1 FAD-dependent oxidoreductase [Pleurocapsa sp. CCALA 161]